MVAEFFQSNIKDFCKGDSEQLGFCPPSRNKHFIKNSRFFYRNMFTVFQATGPHIGYSEQREGKKIELTLDYPKHFCIKILKKKLKNSGHVSKWGKRWDRDPNEQITRMHSSRMRTARSLPYGGGLPNRPPGTDPPGQRPPGQGPPPDRDPPGETPL